MRRLGLAAAASVADGVVLVVPADRASTPSAGVDVVVAGGATRSASVRAGLAAVPADAERDRRARRGPPAGARRAVPERSSPRSRAGADGAVPGVPVTDTVKRVGDGVVAATARPRPSWWPCRPRRPSGPTRSAPAHAVGGEATDDAALVEAAGGTGRGRARRARPTPRSPTRTTSRWRRPAADGGMTVRVGLGFDVHPFSDDPARPLVLGGVALRRRAGPRRATATPTWWPTPSPTPSSARPACGDLGSTSPTTDPAWAGADSIALLGRGRGRVRAAGWESCNVDCTVVAARRPSWRRTATPWPDRLSGGRRRRPVTVKGKRAEGLGAIGRGEGIACLAVALLEAVRPEAAGPG